MSRTRDVARFALRAGRRTGTELALARLRSLAAARGLRLDVQVDPTARISPEVRWIVRGGGSASLTVGPGSVVDPGVEIHFTPDSSLFLGPEVNIRSGCVLGVYGEVRFEGRNLFSWGSVLQCRRRIVFEEMAGTGEHVSVIDGNHYRRDADDHWFGRSTYGPVVIGRNTWLAAKSVVTAGVTIGAASTVAAGAVVTQDLPAECLAGGIPAKVLKDAVNGPPPEGADTEANDSC